jgi:hypothetical protein
MMGAAAWKCQHCYRCPGNGRRATHQQRARERAAWTSEVTSELLDAEHPPQPTEES